MVGGLIDFNHSSQRGRQTSYLKLIWGMSDSVRMLSKLAKGMDRMVWRPWRCQIESETASLCRLSTHRIGKGRSDAVQDNGRDRNLDKSDYYGPSRHRLVFGRFHGVSAYTAYLAPPISRWDEDGFSSCSVCPCHRAAPTTPPEWPAAAARLQQTMLPSPGRSGLGLRFTFFSRPPLGSLALRPGDSLTIPRMALSIGFISFVSSTNAIQATGLLTLAPVGLTPTEQTSLRWTHSPRKIPSTLCSNDLRRS